MTPRTTLITPVQSLLNALQATPPSPSQLQQTFTTTPLPLIHEHGLPQLAPFLGRSFTGQDGVARYFQLLGDDVEIAALDFEPEEMWCVDDVAMAVCLRGSGRFRWKRTDQAWDETFVYRVALAVDLGEVSDATTSASASGSAGAGRDVDLGGVGIGPVSPGGSDLLAGGKGTLKVCEYRIWADTGAAYLARLGRLGELVVEGCVDGSGRGGYEGIHVRAVGKEEEENVDVVGGEQRSGETRRSVGRKRSGGQDVLGSGLNVYGSCG